MSDKFFETNVTIAGEFRIAAINPYSIFCVKTKTFESKRGTVTQETLFNINTTPTSLENVKLYRLVGDQIVVLNGTLDGHHVDDEGNVYIDVFAPIIIFGAESLKNQNQRITMQVAKEGPEGFTLKPSPRKQKTSVNANQNIDLKALLELIREQGRA